MFAKLLWYRRCRNKLKGPAEGGSCHFLVLLVKFLRTAADCTRLQSKELKRKPMPSLSSMFLLFRFSARFSGAFGLPAVARVIDTHFNDVHAFAFKEFALERSVGFRDEQLAALADHAMPGDASSRWGRCQGPARGPRP